MRMPGFTFRALIGGLLLPCAAGAQQLSSVDELVAAMAARGPSDQVLGVRLVDCPAMDDDIIPSVLIAPFQDPSQWLLNGPYFWRLVQYPEGTCVRLFGNDSRIGRPGLDAVEARALLGAAHLDIADRAHAAKQAAFNCHARRDGDFGGHIAAYEEGVINGHRYRIFFAGLGPELAALDAEQHRFGEEQKARLLRAPPRPAPAGPAFELDLGFRSAGRTRELAALHAHFGQDAAGPQPAAASWLLHRPSGRLITFEELFTDPKTVRERIVRNVLDYLPEYKAQSIPVIGANELTADLDPIESGATVHARTQAYTDLARRLLSPSPDRLERVSLVSTDGRVAYFIGRFGFATGLEGGLPPWWARADDLDGAFNREFQSVLEMEPCPPRPET